MGRKKLSTTVYLRDDQFAALKGASQRTGVPMASLIREAVDDLLEKHGAHWRACSPMEETDGKEE